MDVSWLEQRFADVPAHDDWLSFAERERLAMLKIPKRRADWRLGRWTAKVAVANLYGTDRLAQIEIIAHPTGAPTVVLAGEPAGITLSLSHSAGVGACAIVEQGRVGCDLEVIEDRSEAFLQDFFSGDELAMFAGSAASIASMATIAWSAKESALKAIREGLRRDTRSVIVERVELQDLSAWRPLTVRCDPEVFSGWWYEADGLVRTVVASPAPAVPTCLEVFATALV